MTTGTHTNRMDDIWGGTAATLVALPSAIAFGVVVFTSVSPDLAGAGATAGVLGAIAMGLVAPLVGGNGGFVSAPCAPPTAVLAGLATSVVGMGLAQDRVIGLMTLTVVLAAAIQATFGVAKLGRMMKFIPYQVVSGFLSGVAVLIALGQLPKFLGLPKGLSLWAGLVSPGDWQWPGMVVGAVTIAGTALAPRFTQKVPGVIIGLGGGIAVYWILAAMMPELATLEGNDLVIGELAATGGFFAGVSARAKGLLAIEGKDVALVVGPAVALAALMSIDTLKTGVLRDALTGGRHNSNRELIGQGLANATSALIGGIPGGATSGPTLVNLSSGGSSPLSGATTGLLSLVAFLFLLGAISWVPIGALAGILLFIAWKMFDGHLFRLARHRSTRLDFVVISTVVIVAAVVGLMHAAAVGVGLAMLLFIRDQTRSPVMLHHHTLANMRSKTRRVRSARHLLDDHGDEAAVVELTGNLFFGTTDALFTQLDEDLKRVRFLLFDMRRVQSMDYTAGHLFEQMQGRLAERDGKMLLCGMPTSAPTGLDFEKYLKHLGVVGKHGHSTSSHKATIFDTRDEALSFMEDEILAAAGFEEDEEGPPLDLNDFELFREFDAEHLAALAEAIEPRSIEADATLFAAGDTGDEAFLVRSGEVRIHLPVGGGKIHHLATFVRGDFFGELAFLDQGTRSADAVASRPTEVYVLSRERFNEVSIRHPELGTMVFARIALGVSDRLRTADKELQAWEAR